MVGTTSAQPRFTRRALLEVGGLATLGIGLPDLLSAESLDGAARRAKSCIFIYQYGGLSQLDSWDMKPQGPETIRGPYKPIATRIPGYQVCELMPRLATLADQYCVIRSLNHAVPVHDVANRMLLAGQPLPSLDAPSFGSIVAKARPSDAAVPSYVWLQKFGGGAMPPDRTYLTGGWLGAAYSPLLVGAGHDDNPATPGWETCRPNVSSSVNRCSVRSTRSTANSTPPPSLEPSRNIKSGRRTLWRGRKPVTHSTWNANFQRPANATVTIRWDKICSSRGV
jgi:hypothetical protein